MQVGQSRELAAERSMPEDRLKRMITAWSLLSILLWPEERVGEIVD